MHYYKVKLRLDGNTMNEVRRVFSATEVLIMQFLHGSDATTEVEFAYEKKINLNDEKHRLKGIYDQSLGKKEQSIDTIFGPLGSIAEVLPDDMLNQFGITSEGDALSIAKSVTQIDKSGRKPENITEANRVDRLVPQEEISMADIMG